jgi:hypothetical protein
MFWKKSGFTFIVVEFCESTSRIGSENKITRKINETIIPEFNTNAEGCAFDCLNFLMITRIVIAVRGRTIKSFMI